MTQRHRTIGRSSRPRKGLALFRRPSPMRLNLTAMIDVVFQLLIYFVVTASFSQGEGVLKARLPGEGQGSALGPPPPSAQLTVRVASTGTYAYRLAIEPGGLTPSSFHELADTLERLKGVYGPDTPVIIQPDRALRWQHVVSAFNAAVRARYDNVAFATATD
jgi:biopolymer transport protein ExbD